MYLRHIMLRVIDLNTKTRIVLTLTSVVLLFSIGFTYYKTESAINEYSRYILKNTVHFRVNSCIYAYIADNESLFASICKYSYTESGSISTISINSAAVNTIQAELEKAILTETEKLRYESFKMPMGNVSGTKLLSGYGPKINVKIVPLGTIECDTINTFDSVGINHTLHRVGLKFTASFSGAPPFGGTVHKTEFYVALCENIIAGEVPHVFFS